MVLGDRGLTVCSCVSNLRHDVPLIGDLLDDNAPGINSAEFGYEILEGNKALVVVADHDEACGKAGHKNHEGLKSGFLGVPRRAHGFVKHFRSAHTINTAIRLEAYGGFIPASNAIPDMVIGRVGMGRIGWVHIGDCGSFIFVCESVSDDV